MDRDIFDLQGFERYLKRCNLSERTIISYLTSMRLYLALYKDISKNTLLAYKSYLIDENYAPKTINNRINAINKYLSFIGRKSLKLTCVKIQNKPFVENVISNADYKQFVKLLKRDKEYKTYFIVKFLACTGVRVSELVKFKVEHVYKGYMDVYGKGGKFRRIWIPKKLQSEAINQLMAEGRDYGSLFLNKNGETLETTGVTYLLKKYAKKYGLPVENVYPHSFRHLYAQNFIEKGVDLMTLASILGHSNIETTRIYVNRSSADYAALIDNVVSW